MLVGFEEVYETVSPESIKKANQLLQEIAEEIFKTTSKPNRFEINLLKFSVVDEITKYTLKKIMNYSNVAKGISEVSSLISELSKVRKELFLKVS